MDNYPYTGCKHNGTEEFLSRHSQALGSLDFSGVMYGRPNSSANGHGLLNNDRALANTTSRPLYGLSEVFQVAAAVGINNPPVFSADAASFDITTTSGSAQIRTKAGVTYDFETKPSYSVTVKADDGNEGTDTIAVTITVTDVDEPPCVPAPPSVSARPGSNSSLIVTWTAPANTGPDITSYDLRYREGTTGDFTDGPQDVTDTSAAIGSGSLTPNTSYEVQVRATNAVGDSGWSDSGVGTTALIATGGICSRTEAVRNTFLTKISDISDCADVTSTHLATIASFIFLRPQDITALAAGDFDGLTSLTSLTLQDNMLSMLPAGVFDGLTSLTSLTLGDNMLSTLPAEVFDGLTSLMTLTLGENRMSTLPAGVFDDLTSLTSLTLQDNMLSMLPAGVFDGLTSLTSLTLGDNMLSTLPAGMFDGLTSLMTLQLQNNMLSTLPAGVFKVLILLTRLNLGGNPGASFAPEAVALPDDGRVLYTGGTVRLDGSFTDGGPWGANVTWSWALTDPKNGVTVRFDDAASATPTVTVPALAEGTELTFTLTVTGRGAGQYSDGFAPGIDTARVTAKPPDITAPTVTSILRQTPTASPTDADELTWRVTFSEEVANVDSADFEVSDTTAALTATAVQGSSLAWDVKASGGDLGSLNATVTLAFAHGSEHRRPGGQRQYGRRAGLIHLHRSPDRQHRADGDFSHAPDPRVIADRCRRTDLAGDLQRGSGKRGLGGLRGHRDDGHGDSRHGGFFDDRRLGREGLRGQPGEPQRHGDAHLRHGPGHLRPGQQRPHEHHPPRARTTIPLSWTTPRRP